jgi:hypothetical protein
MKNFLPPLVLLFLFNYLPGNSNGQTVTVKSEPTVTEVSITEPATIQLEKLFKMADVVAVVRIVSGDTENYKTTIYKAVVVSNFKGTTDGQTLYYGPYIGGRIGWEYVVFLRSVKESAIPKNAKSPAYGVVKYFEVFDEGYTSMEGSYRCVFDGREINNECDYGIKVCTDYIVLPKGTPVFPPLEVDDVPFGCRWVRKSKFLSLLTEFTNTEAPKLR